MITSKDIDEAVDELEWDNPEQRAMVVRHLDQLFALLRDARKELSPLEYVLLLAHIDADLREE